MKSVFSFLIIFSPMCLAATGAEATNQWHSINKITQAADQHLAHHYLSLYPDYDIKVSVNAPDSRLKLRQCDKELTVNATNLPIQGGNATVQIQCEDQTPWSIHLSSNIEVWADVVVTATSVSRGTVLTDQDLSLQRTNLASARKGSLLQIQDAVGLEARRSLRPHHPIRVQDLAEPLVIHRGDAVQVAANIGGLKVITPGTALANGRVGEQIAIENSRSNRKIRAKVVAEGLVEVPM